MQLKHVTAYGQNPVKPLKAYRMLGSSVWAAGARSRSERTKGRVRAQTRPVGVYMGPYRKKWKVKPSPRWNLLQ